ncbi:IclR family transcriptional regulator [Haladaptatus pallidirubidus]|uniref:IclR family transcriptional regulator n=1 Tax=Haladaptatus pallidirubidus TaxID=1008152 RepID=A0AAV3UPL7_9EURY|nr:IclR family transcriptional regulator [Haladaptatus pallidirubidus]
MGNNANETNLVKSDETLFAIIEQLRESDGAGVTELAKQLDMAKSSIHKHLHTMVKHGYVVKRNDTYHIGLQFLNFGEYVRDSYDIYHASKSKIHELAERTGEMVWLIIPENGLGWFLYGEKGDSGISEESIVGSWTYLHNNSGGKAILANLPSEQIDNIIDQHGLPTKTENTITDLNTLRTELENIRERGYAVNQGEDIAGIHAVGVPLISDGEIQGALSIAGAAHRFKRDQREQKLAEYLITAADDIEVNLAYQ